METRIWSETKIPMLIGLIAEGIFLLGVLMYPFLVIMQNDSSQEIVTLNTQLPEVPTLPLVIFTVVLIYAFLRNFNGYRQLMIHGAAPSDAYMQYQFQLMYGILALFFNPVAGIAYISSFALGASRAKYLIENL